MQALDDKFGPLLEPQGSGDHYTLEDSAFYSKEGEELQFVLKLVGISDVGEETNIWWKKYEEMKSMRLNIREIELTERRILVSKMIENQRSLRRPPIGKKELCWKYEKIYEEMYLMNKEDLIKMLEDSKYYK